MNSLSASKGDQFKITTGKRSARVNSLSSFQTNLVEKSRDKMEGSLPEL